MSFLSDAIQILQTSSGLNAMTREALNCHATCYRENLGASSEAMLQYEWAWVEEHLQALRRCQRDPSLLAQLGGEEKVNILISECVLFQLILQEEFSRRRLCPSPAPAPVVPSEEAWEITSLQVKKDWGIVPA